MTKATIAGLVAFINAQPASRPVDHTSWSSCAVGAYSREVLGREPVLGAESILGGAALSPKTTVWQLFEECGTANPVGARVFGQYPQSSRSLMDELRLADKGRQNYGQLRTAMAEKFPKLGFSHKPAWFTEWSSRKFKELTGTIRALA